MNGESVNGFVWGMCAMILVVLYIPYGTYCKAKQAVEECEKQLPRDQKCIIYAKQEEVE